MGKGLILRGICEYKLCWRANGKAEVVGGFYKSINRQLIEISEQQHIKYIFSNSI